VENYKKKMIVIYAPSRITRVKIADNGINFPEESFMKRAIS
jgi:hypothetical protein